MAQTSKVGYRSCSNGWHGELLLPLQNAGASRGGLRFGNVAGLLESDREAGVSQRVVGSECGESERSRNCCLELLRIAQCADEAVMGFDMVVVGGYGLAKGLGRPGCIAFGEQTHAALRESVRRYGLRVGSDRHFLMLPSLASALSRYSTILRHEPLPASPSG
jgi:hypothetical protein